MTNGSSSLAHRVTCSLRLLRLECAALAAIISGAGAYAAHAGLRLSLALAAAGGCLAIGKYVFDILLDRRFAAAAIPPQPQGTPESGSDFDAAVTIRMAIISLVLSAIILTCFSIESFLCWAVVLILSFALAVSLIRTALARVLGTGLLSTLFFLMGGAAGKTSRVTFMLAGMIFFAGTGISALQEIRRRFGDRKSPVETLPKRYGIPGTIVIAVISLFAAAGCGLGALWMNELPR